MSNDNSFTTVSQQFHNDFKLSCVKIGTDDELKLPYDASSGSVANYTILYDQQHRLNVCVRQDRVRAAVPSNSRIIVY